MKCLLALVVLLGGCRVTMPDPPKAEAPPPKKIQRERPTVNLPLALRQKNWLGYKGEGSCTHATMTSLFRWQGQYELAEWWKRNNGNGCWDDDMNARFDRAGVTYAFTSEKADVRFLDWACRTRRGCGITVMGGRHMVALVFLDDKWAGLLDNNRVDRIIWVPRATLIAEWTNSGSWAVVPIVAAPMPPMPAK